MCGLTAIVAYGSGKTILGSELNKINENMRSRGPDGSGEWTSDCFRIGLAHRRLSIIDTSDAGLQPMISSCGNARIVFNGEIYNFKELRSKLQLYGHRFLTDTDTEVILLGWLQWGDGIVYHLKGMYTFVIWDEIQQSIFVARDPFGIKPLYYSDDGGVLRFASQVNALAKNGAIDLAPDYAGHVGFFLTGSVPEPHTLYKNISPFPAGHCLLMRISGEKVSRQFSNIANLLEVAQEKAFSFSSSDVKEYFRQALHDSVKKHLIADVPSCVFLSAGIDSSALSILASKIQGTNLNTVTLGFKEFNGSNFDEVPIAESLAATLKSKHRSSYISRNEFDEDFSRFMNAMDQPTIDGVNTWFVSKAARAVGVKVALSGLGADELLGGYPSFKHVPQLVSMVKPLNAVNKQWSKELRKLLSPMLQNFTSTKYAGIFEYGGSYPGAYFLRRALYMPWELASCLPYDVIQQGLPEIMDELLSLEVNSSLSLKGKVSELELGQYMKNQLLRTSDWASMAHGLELRVPFVDLDVLSASAVANKQTLASSADNRVMKRIAKRKKSGFETPVAQWLKARTPLKSNERGLRGWAQAVYGSYTS
ncbi:asparagine synthase (glutamine-hydrolyzing) [Amylibacter sp.]|nr:asparagine synthase (glutamine-hydrolyzing) [Amylibacter sp.]